MIVCTIAQKDDINLDSRLKYSEALREKARVQRYSRKRIADSDDQKHSNMQYATQTEWFLTIF